MTTIKISDSKSREINGTKLFRTQRFAEQFGIARERVVQIHGAERLDTVMIDGVRFFVMNDRNKSIINQKTTLKK